MHCPVPQYSIFVLIITSINDLYYNIMFSTKKYGLGECCAAENTRGTAAHLGMLQTYTPPFFLTTCKTLPEQANVMSCVLLKLICWCGRAAHLLAYGLAGRPMSTIHVYWHL